MEVLQVLQALRGRSKGWMNHPAVRMWRGYEQYLITYGITICEEWISRGYKDTCQGKIVEYVDDSVLIKPSWLTEAFCSNHRSILLGKTLEAIIECEDTVGKLSKYGAAMQTYRWYLQLGWSEAPAIRNKKGQWPYIWPV